jgi:hypothetical protein
MPLPQRHLAGFGALHARRAKIDAEIYLVERERDAALAAIDELQTRRAELDVAERVLLDLSDELQFPDEGP